MAIDRTAAQPPTPSPSESGPGVQPVEPARPRQYSPPKLRHLGSVRDLTLGVRGGANEFPGAMGMKKQ